MKAPAPLGVQPPLRDPDAARKVNVYIAALGGKGNIVRVDACAQTRIRVVVQDEARVNQEELSAYGIAAVANPERNTLHLLSDLNADQYAAEMRAQIAA